jgi:hypothetical protein
VYTLRRTQRARSLSVKINMRVALLIVASLALGCNGRLLLADTPAISISVPKNDVWDYMMLVQQWPVELCQHAVSWHFKRTNVHPFVTSCAIRLRVYDGYCEPARDRWE